MSATRPNTRAPTAEASRVAEFSHDTWLRGADPRGRSDRVGAGAELHVPAYLPDHPRHRHRRRLPGVRDDYLTWRLLLGLGAIPGLAVFYLRRQIHETPRFAMAGGAADEAQAAISAATGGKPAVSTAVESKARNSQSVASGYLKLFRNRRLLIWLIGTAGGWALLDFCYYGNTISQPNTTTFIYPAERFPTDVRTTGHGIAAGAGKLGVFAGAFLFPDFLAVTLGLNRAMVIAGVVAVLGMLLTIATLPETNGKTLEQLEEDAPMPAKVRTQPGLAR